MFRTSSIFILLAFFIWILPLGAFIKISQEGKICGGQRAFCLCSANFKVKDKNAKTALTSMGQMNKEAASSGGANREFSVDKMTLDLSMRQEDLQLSFFNPATVLFIKSIEHVPKA